MTGELDDTNLMINEFTKGAKQNSLDIGRRSPEVDENLRFHTPLQDDTTQTGETDTCAGVRRRCCG